MEHRFRSSGDGPHCQQSGAGLGSPSPDIWRFPSTPSLRDVLPGPLSHMCVFLGTSPPPPAPHGKTAEVQPDCNQDCCGQQKWGGGEVPARLAMANFRNQGARWLLSGGRDDNPNCRGVATVRIREEGQARLRGRCLFDSASSAQDPSPKETPNAAGHHPPGLPSSKRGDTEGAPLLQGPSPLPPPACTDRALGSPHSTAAPLSRP